MRICIVYIYTYLCMYMYLYMHAYAKYICIYKYIYIYIYIYVYIHTCKYTYINVYIYMHIYVYIHIQVALVAAALPRRRAGAIFEKVYSKGLLVSFCELKNELTPDDFFCFFLLPCRSVASSVLSAGMSCTNSTPQIWRAPKMCFICLSRNSTRSHGRP